MRFGVGRGGGVRTFFGCYVGCVFKMLWGAQGIPDDGRTVVPIKAANSVHALLLSAKIGQKLYVFVQLLMKYV